MTKPTPQAQAQAQAQAQTPANGPHSAEKPAFEGGAAAHFLSLIPAGVKQTPIDRRYAPDMPPCPLCGAPALAGYGLSRYDDIRHECSCDLVYTERYYAELRREDSRRRRLDDLRRVVPVGSQAASAADYPGAPMAGALIGRALSAAGPSGRFIHGAPGAGKTHLAAAIALAAAQAGHTVAFWGFNDLLNANRQAVATGQRPPDVLSPALLVLDDLGKCKPTEFSYELIYGVANARWERGKATVYTANHAPGITAQSLTPQSLFSEAHDRQAAAAALSSRFAASGTFAVSGHDRRARD